MGMRVGAFSLRVRMRRFSSGFANMPKLRAAVFAANVIRLAVSHLTSGLTFVNRHTADRIECHILLPYRDNL